jgi:hypothetical protein
MASMRHVVFHLGINILVFHHAGAMLEVPSYSLPVVDGVPLALVRE